VSIDSGNVHETVAVQDLAGGAGKTAISQSRVEGLLAQNEVGFGRVGPGIIYEGVGEGVGMQIDEDSVVAFGETGVRILIYTVDVAEVESAVRRHTQTPI